MNFYIGIDFGTSGARLVITDPKGNIHQEVESPFPESSSPNELPVIWKTTLFDLIAKIPLELRRQTGAIAIDGTSATTLLCDRQGKPITSPLLYNDGRGVEIMEQSIAIAPENHPVLSATSSLAKLLWWQHHHREINTESQPLYFLHQADWLGFLLHGKLGISDYHNTLKLGYDVAHLHYPRWLTNEINRESNPLKLQLPEVLAPGTPIGEITLEISEQLNLPKHCVVCAGTTDSIAAFLASGATSPGEAVTSLGSTLVLKLLSDTPVNDARYGIYSHRLGNLWLTGGASNTGGAVLREFFSDRELETLSNQINPNISSPLDYYPLLKKGDRFPINDPSLPPRLEPRPDNSVEFLHGLLESIARIEARGYQRLQELGATPLSQVYTAGGGAKNPVWTTIRGRYLKVPMVQPIHTAAAYGAARLAYGVEKS
ncbi:FGGY-family carbohydrate kinase [Capilliphycus salinus ALCB114379]|uniref:FGGY-family carbohydrate kinase n=1 Tax=Capilliphycus salinus TaxID=2768948 RepID=UPI0039A67FF6